MNRKLLAISLLLLFTARLFSMQIIIRINSQYDITLEVEPNDSIDAIKAKIQEKKSVPPNQQCLSFEGEELEEGKTLSDYNIRSQSILDLADWLMPFRCSISDTSILTNTLLIKVIPDSVFSYFPEDLRALQSDGTSLPAWMEFNKNTNTFTGTPIKTDTLSVVLVATSEYETIFTSKTFTIIATTTEGDKSYVADHHFRQALIAQSYGAGMDGDSVPKENISGITYLDVSNKNISDLTGIESFLALEKLICSDNELSALDVSKNTALQHLNCANNQLINLDIRNTRNAIITDFDASNNPNLTCIYVDDKDAVYFAGWVKDASALYVNSEAECKATFVNYLTEKAISIYPNPTNGVVNLDFAGRNIRKVKVIDLMGKIMNEKTNLNQFETIDLSGFENGLYFIVLQTHDSNTSYKIMKK